MIDIERLMSIGCRSGATVGIGLSRSDYHSAVKTLRSLRCSVTLRRFEDARSLVNSLRDGKIDAAVRGTMSSSVALRELKRAFGLEEVMRTALLDGPDGRPFLLAPVGIDEGRDYASRLALVTATMSYFEPAGWKIDIGILSKGRAEDKHRGPEIESSLVEARRMARALNGLGLSATDHQIMLEMAVKTCGLVVAPDGVSGNLIFRALHFVGGKKAYGAPVVNIAKVFVDTSRAKTDFTDSVRLAAGLFQVRLASARSA